MDSTNSDEVSQEEFNLFHTIDRELFKILTITLSRDPTESMKILAMWLWLERVGFRNVVHKILSLPQTLINDIADETLMCLTCMGNEVAIPLPLLSNKIPLLQSLIDKEISLKFMYENRLNTFRGVTKLVEEICMRAFIDIMQEAVMIKDNSLSKSSPSASRLGSEVVVHYVPPENRTLFVTFSKGYRVEEHEVKHFFTQAYGDCIEALYMQEVRGNQQPLFARIVFHKLETIETILSGITKVKFSINGKHVWARKFVPKQAPPPSLLPPILSFPGESSKSG